MLTSLALKNFKCFEELDVPLRRVTVLIGPNGSGKSSVLQALMLLRQSLGKTQLLLRGDFIDLSGPGPMVFRGDQDRSVSFGFEAARSVVGTPTVLAYELESAADCAVRKCRASLKWDSEGLEAYWCSPTGGFVNPDYDPSLMEASAAIGDPFKPTNDLERWSGMKKLVGAHRLELESWRFVPAIRGFSRQTYRLQEKGIDYLHPGWHYESMQDGLATTWAQRRDLRFRVSSWTEAITGVTVDYSLVEGLQIMPEAASSVAERNVPLANEGFGTNQLVFLMFQLANTPAEGVVGVEEPEAHLHPLAIARLGDLFVRVAADENKQILLTTHSDHLLYSLLNNVAEGKLAPDQLAIHYFEARDHAIVVTPVEVTPEGQVRGGLPGFFDAALEAQRRKVEALSRAP